MASKGTMSVEGIGFSDQGEKKYKVVGVLDVSMVHVGQIITQGRLDSLDKELYNLRIKP